VRGLAPLGSYAAVFPPDADVEKLAYHFVADYDCASHRYPGVMERMAQEIAAWQQRWAPDAAALPVLHVLPSGDGDGFLLFDTRGLADTQPIQVLDREQASVALTMRLHVDTPEVAWALDNKLGAIVDERYLPLATAEPQLLQAFEDAIRNERADDAR
jgi:hypothetical protein